MRVRAVLSLLPFLLLALPSALGQASVTATYVASSDVLRAPERGFFVQPDSREPITAGLMGYYRATFPEATLILRVFLLEEYRDRPLDAARLAQIDADLTAIRAAGYKAIVRFS